MPTENKGQWKRGHIPWNKNTKGLLVPWNKGLTKENDQRVMKYYSLGRKGEMNPSHGREKTKESIEKQRKSMMESIESGRFTPNIHNSKTHWQIEYKGKKFRSSWEAMFYQLNQNLEYEKIRVPYFIGDKKKIYIIDFVDNKDKVLYEVKPKRFLKMNNFPTKKAAAEHWAEKNGFELRIITEDYFKDNFTNIDLNEFDPDTRDKIIKLMRRYESNK